MGLELRKNSKWWYGKFTLMGAVRVISLQVKVDGVRPPRMTVRGDERFERSRLRARDRFVEIKAEFSDPARAASRLRRIHELQSGTSLKPLSIATLKDFYLRKQRQRPISSGHEAQSLERIERFCVFMAERYPRIADLRLVTPPMVLEFMADQQARGITLATLNRVRESLVAAFNGAMKLADLAKNPFKDVVKYDEYRGQVHRTPFSVQEITKILNHVAEQPVVGPIIVTSLCTAMRRKNCALLQWRQVDLVNNLIKVQTFKTGVWVTIPLFPALRSVLEQMPRNGELCFPEAAEMYEKNPDGLTWRFMKVLLSSGVVDRKIRDPATVEVEMKGRIRAPSTQAFAACKTTFVTLALNAGVPEAMLRKVVGNKSLQLVLDHYYQPGQAELKRQFLAKMPSELTGAKPVENFEVKIERLIQLASEIQAENWEHKAATLRQGLRELRVE